MRRLSMFSRLLILFMAVILTCVLVLSVLSYINMRNNAVDSRMDALKTQAREMAYLASRLPYDQVMRAFGPNSATENYMRWKSTRIYEEYNAYIVVVDRAGNNYMFYNEATLADKSLQALPSQKELASYMEQVMMGQEVVRQTQSASGPLFTVLVPWEQENFLTGDRIVMGFVLIQTAAQTVQAAYQGLLWQTALAAGGLLMIAALAVFLIARQMTRPLTAMASAAESMAKGDFNARAPEEGSREIQALASTFNGMADQLSSLEQSRRDFVANVSHELRSPVTSIQGFAQGMLDGTIPEQEHQQYLQVVVDETRRLAKLINNLLNLSRIENEQVALTFSTFDINELTRRVLISRMAQIEEKQLDIDADLDDAAQYASGDPDQIQQVLINLLDNAIKFTPAGGSIFLRTRMENGRIILRVKDTGTGILPEDAAHIFERFYTADKAHTGGKGTGLGLAICHRIMERHGQSIRLVSGEGGATFEFTLAPGQHSRGRAADDGTESTGEN